MQFSEEEIKRINRLSQSLWDSSCETVNGVAGITERETVVALGRVVGLFLKTAADPYESLKLLNSLAMNEMFGQPTAPIQ